MRKMLLCMLLLSGCSLSPDFSLPEFKLPSMFKEDVPPPPPPAEQVDALWKPAEPLEQADRGQWWKIFGEAPLNDMEQEALIANQSLQAAAARVEQARALVRANALSFLPDVTLGANASRAQPSNASLAAFGFSGGTLKPYTLYSAGATASYELDVFGRVRDNEKAYRADAEAQVALYQSVLLALQADVAQHYFALRALDAERALLRETVAIRAEAQRIMQRRFDVGDVGTPDVTRTQSELAATQATLTALDRDRATREHALAVLLGKLPSEFTFAEAPLTAVPPQIPPGLPSKLLERRPDIAAAAAAMASANARIGVARTAFFPNIILTASGGYESTELGELFKWGSRTWALGQLAGTAISWTVFESGRNFARVDAAKAAYAEALANYRQQVLVAFRDVEDNLTAQRLLADQAMQQNAAADAARKTTELVQKRYDEGDAAYFEVVDAQRTSLAAQRAAIQVEGQRFATTIALIRALGGGWGETVQQPVPEMLPEVKTEIKPVEKVEEQKEVSKPDTDIQPLPETVPNQ